MSGNASNQSFVNACYIALNIVVSIGIVITNKILFNKYNFPFGTFLTFIHFVCTVIGLELCASFGMYERKRIAWREVVGLSAAFCGFVVLTNLSLVYNSVGFYQLAKVMTTPTIVVIQSVSYNMTFSNKIKLSLLTVCVGVIIASVTDVELNWLGTFYAVTGVLTTSYYQIWVGTRQKELQVNSMQLLSYQAPLSCLMILPIVFVMEDMPALRSYEWTASVVYLVLITGALAFLVNVSIFLIIGRTSPVTYNVVGHFKTCCVLVLGFLIFSYPLDVKNISGIIITLAGVFAYTKYKLQETAGQRTPLVDKDSDKSLLPMSSKDSNKGNQYVK